LAEGFAAGFGALAVDDALGAAALGADAVDADGFAEGDALA
jgi:hypothetical protein